MNTLSHNEASLVSTLQQISGSYEQVFFTKKHLEKLIPHSKPEMNQNLRHNLSDIDLNQINILHDENGNPFIQRKF